MFYLRRHHGRGVHIDAVGLLMLDPAAVILTEVPQPALALLIDSGAEDARLGEAVGLHDGRGMHDHKVDGAARGGVATRAVVSGGLCEGDGGIEATRGDGDDTHVVVHLHIVVDTVLAVHGVTGDAALEQTVQSRIHEQDAALVGNFRIVQFLRAKVDGGNRAATRGDVLGGLHAVGGILAVVAETDCVSFQFFFGASR